MPSHASNIVTTAAGHNVSVRRVMRISVIDSFLDMHFLIDQ